MASQPSVQQEVEYGYRTPDGKEHFGEHPSPFYAPKPSDLRYEHGQKKAQAEFEKALKRAGVPGEGMKLEFIQRARVTTYTAATPIVIEKLQDWGADDDDDLPEGF